MKTNSPLAKSQVLRQCETVLRKVLPPSWRLAAAYGQRRTSGLVDAVFNISTPLEEQIDFVVGAERILTTRSILNAVDQVTRYIGDDNRSQRPMIVSQYISPRSREVLKGLSVSFIDVTGNIRVINDLPGLFIESQGATKNPWAEDTPLRTLKGRGAGRAVRALVDMRPPFGVRELGLKTNVPIATLSRVIDLLERDALLDRDDDGGVMKLDWMNTIRRWSQDYELRKSNTVDMYLEPRGIPSLLNKLGQVELPYAITSSLAADWFSPIAPAQIATIFVENSGDFANEIGLRQVDTGANVALIEPFDKVVFERTMQFEELLVAAPSQVAVDLLTGPGREPSEGEELLLWMKRNLDVWQS